VKNPSITWRRGHNRAFPFVLGLWKHKRAVVNGLPSGGVVKRMWILL
jgi:hypothetical protein